MSYTYYSRFTLAFVFVFILLIFSPLNAQQNYFSKTYYDPSDTDHPYIINTNQLANKNVIVSGRYISSPLLLLDTLGNTIWSKKIECNHGGGIHSISPTSDTCILISGEIISSSELRSEFFCVKIDAMGDTLWSKAFKTGEYSTIISVKSNETIDGNYLFFTQYLFDYEVGLLLTKTSPNGTVLWQRRHITHENQIPSFNEFMIYNDFTEDVNGNLFLSGNRSIHNGLVSKFNSNGYHISSVEYDLDDYLTWGIEIIDTFLYIGLTKNGSPQPEDYAKTGLMKTRFNGTIEWFITFPVMDSLENDNQHRLKTTLNRQILMIPSKAKKPIFSVNQQGDVVNVAYMDSIPLSNVQPLNNGEMMFFSPTTIPLNGGHTYSSNIYKTNSIMNGNSCLNSILVDRIYEPSPSKNPTNFPGVDSLDLVPFYESISLNNVLIESFDDCGQNYNIASTIETSLENNTINVFPNSSNGVFTFQKAKGSIGIITIINSTGKQIYSSKIKANKGTIDLRNHTPGIYFYSIVDEYKHHKMGKLIILD